jgi:hypothetical protein
MMTVRMIDFSRSDPGDVPDAGIPAPAAHD